MKQRIQQNIAMKPMSFIRHAFAYVTLGLLCGWYYFLMILYPILIFLAFHGSYIAAAIFGGVLVLTFVPLPEKHSEAVMFSFVFDIWREYFDFTYDISTIRGKLDANKRYMFFELPHGIFPMGQFLSASVIPDITPGKMVCGLGADIIFNFPIMRQLMVWIGTRKASRKNITKIFEEEIGRAHV
jgi:hypothetical protein